MDIIGVQADEASTSAATDTPLSVSVLTDTAVNSLTVNHLEKQVVSVKEDGNITVPTSVVTTDSLEDAKASAIKKVPTSSRLHWKFFRSYRQHQLQILKFL